MAATKPVFLDSKAILAYLLNTDDALDTLITINPNQQPLETYDVNLYEALGSVNPEELRIHRLAKLLEGVDVLPFRKMVGKEKPVLTNERVRELRTEIQR